MVDEITIKASPADVVKRLMSIKKEGRYSYRKLAKLLNANTAGYITSATSIQRSFKGEFDPGLQLLVPLASVLGYNPSWILLGISDKKLTKETSKIVTDIQAFRTEMDVLQAMLKAANARLTIQDNKIAHLERELKELKENTI